jgi:hypothetical protein
VRLSERYPFVRPGAVQKGTDTAAPLAYAVAVTSVEHPSGPAQAASAAVPAEQAQDFERRWAIWVARGRAHDLALKRRFTIVLLSALPLALVAALAYGVYYR